MKKHVAKRPLGRGSRPCFLLFFHLLFSCCLINEVDYVFPFVLRVIMFEEFLMLKLICWGVIFRSHGLTNAMSVWGVDYL